KRQQTSKESTINISNHSGCSSVQVCILHDLQPQADENGHEKHNSKTDTHRKDPCRFTLVHIECVGREIYFLVGETPEQSTLDIDASLIGSRSLAHQTKSKPIDG